MMFKSGKEAIQYYVERRARGFVCAGSEYIMEDEGAHLQYDSNKIFQQPAYTTVVETLLDLEKIFKATLNPLEIQTLLAWGANTMNTEDLNPHPDPTEYECPRRTSRGGVDFHNFKRYEALSERGRYYRMAKIMIRLESGLEKYKYLKREDENGVRLIRTEYLA